MEQAARTHATGRTRYEDDLYTWVHEQVALLRAGRLDEVDAENVAEELSDVGRSEFAKLASALEVVLVQMLQWDHRPDRRTRSWDNSVAIHRLHYGEVLKDNPGLKSRRNEALRRAYRLARLTASSKTGLPTRRLPAECPYGWDDLLERDFGFDSLGQSS